MMNIKPAEQIIFEYDAKKDPTEEEVFMVTEALSWMIEDSHSPDDMMHLGDIWFERKEYEKALKYYEMASEYEYDPADERLGDIYYHGLAGKTDYRLAFYHYEESMKRGNPHSARKTAEMYKYGHYVKQNSEKYEEIMSSLQNETDGKES
ncbi:MAG: sel1 repeat family protein [Eubacterium sp.]|nr:sel1 repeat family protein [Eubacterium sp.]